MSKQKSKKRKSPSEIVVEPASEAGTDTASAPKDAKPSKDARAAAKLDKVAAKAAKAAARDVEKAAEKEAEKEARKSRKAAKRAATDVGDGAMPRFRHLRDKRLSSGKGPSPREIGESLVALFNAGKAEEAESTWYHRKIESIESEGQVFDGIKGVAEKSAWWNANFTVVSMRAAELYACATGFTVVYKGRVKGPDGVERDANEVGVYTVEKGRIVREQFMV
jgi:hypothetical protein